MKKLFTLGLALLAGAMTAQAQLANTGGPDTYGYTWKTSAATGGPTYHWLDITSRGTLMQSDSVSGVGGLADDNSAAAITMPFVFPFYLSSFNQVRVAANGYLTFAANTNLAQPFDVIPTADRGHGRAFIAGYLSDLNFSAGTTGNFHNPGRCYYYANADSIIVSYINLPFWTRSTSSTDPDFRGSNTFQIILSRVDGSITVQYKDLDPNQPVPDPQNNPNAVVIGLEDLTETIGLQAGLNQLPANGSAIKFYRPPTTTLQFLDAAANWFNNPEAGGIFTLLNQPMDVMANISNSGNQPTGSFPTLVRIQNRQGGPATPLYSQTVTVPNLQEGHDTTLMMPQYTPTTNAPSLGTGAFRVLVQTSLQNDQNILNNTTRSVFVVVDTSTGPEYILSYDDVTPADPVGFGAGVYFKPPYYPAQLDGTEAFINGVTGTPDTRIEVAVYADNGPDGSPGTRLFIDTLETADVTLAALNTMPLLQPIRISSGGVYISWVPVNSDSVFVMAHTITSAQDVPPAHRSFEVVSGAFSPYRNADENIAITAIMKTRVAPDTTTGVSPERNGLLTLRPLFPNPATERTTISYSLRQSAPVSLTITDLLGRPVCTMALGQPRAGEYQADVNVADLPAGVYVCTLRAGDARLTRKLVVHH